MQLTDHYLDLEKRYLDLEKTCTTLLAEYQELKKEYQELRKENQSLKKEHQELRKENQSLKKENEKLKEKLRTNSKNSSTPPSQDPHREPPKPKRNPTGRKPGGQPGHKGRTRELYSEEQVSKTLDIKPNICPNCTGTNFDQTPVSVEVKQVVELPECPVDITQYQIHTCKCSACGTCVKADTPKEAEKAFGPRLMGFLTMLVSEGHLSKRKICNIAQHMGVKISLGSLCNIHKLATDLLRKPAEDIHEHVLNSKRVNADETSWRVSNKRHWLWVGATENAAFFKINPSRSAKAYQEIFGNFTGTLTTDRYAAYNAHSGNKQTCLSHIDRDFIKMSQCTGIDGRIGHLLEEQLDQVFAFWNKFKEGKISRCDLQNKAVDPQENIKAILMFAAERAAKRKNRSFAYNLLDRFPTLWTFLYEEGVEPTNNHGERTIRGSVILRKLSYGNQSDWGARFIERVMTVSYTLKQTSRNLLTFLSELFTSRVEARPPPPVFL